MADMKVWQRSHRVWMRRQSLMDLVWHEYRLVRHHLQQNASSYGANASTMCSDFPALRRIEARLPTAASLTLKPQVDAHSNPSGYERRDLITLSDAERVPESETIAANIDQIVDVER